LKGFVKRHEKEFFVSPPIVFVLSQVVVLLAPIWISFDLMSGAKLTSIVITSVPLCMYIRSKFLKRLLDSVLNCANKGATGSCIVAALILVLTC